jgi:hypothetical protein
VVSAPFEKLHCRGCGVAYRGRVRWRKATVERCDESVEARLLERLQTLVDRQDILDCLQRYTRGVDRLDEELVASAYHDDAVDDHVIVRGTLRDFIAHWWPMQGTRVTCQHYLSNLSVEIDGDVAYAETYFLSVDRQLDRTDVALGGGRYVDRLERRDGAWRIAERVVVGEWKATAQGGDLPASKSRRDRSDPSYLRR